MVVDGIGHDPGREMPPIRELLAKAQQRSPRRATPELSRDASGPLTIRLADFALDGVAVGENLAPKFKPTTQGVVVWELSKPLTALPSGTLTVSVADKQGNVTRIERTFKVGK